MDRLSRLDAGPRANEGEMASLNADGYFDLRFSQDKIQVLADIYPPQGGGRNITAEEVVNALQMRGVAYGFQFETIEQSITHVSSSAQPAIGIVAAQGKLPVA